MAEMLVGVHTHTHTHGYLKNSKINVGARLDFCPWNSIYKTDQFKK